MIRMATMADIPAILDIYGPYVLTTTHTFEYSVPTQEQFTQRFEAYTARCPWLVWEEEGVVLGYAYGSEPFERAAYGWCAEVSVYLRPEAKGRGIGKKLYAVLEHILWEQGYRVIYALITTENKDSLAFHEAVGYQNTAVMPDCGLKFGRWLGIVWMEKRSETVTIPIRQPVTWREVVKSDKILDDILAILSLS